MSETAKMLHVNLAPGEAGRYAIVPGDPDRCELIAAHLDNPRMVTRKREFTTWEGTLDGERVTVTSTGIGGPSTAICVEELHKCGADTFIRVGTCASTCADVQCGDIVVVSGSVRMDGTSLHYLPMEFPAVPSYQLLKALEESSVSLGFHTTVGVSITKDSFYTQAEPETKPRPAAREAGKKSEGADMERSMRRARAKLRRLALANDFDYFVTLTLDPARIDRYDSAAITRALGWWADNMVRRHGLRYVLVPERHKDGAFHFHGFMAGPGLKAVDSGKKWNGRTVYNLPQWTLGFTTAEQLYGDYHAAVGYCCKYIGKQDAERPLLRVLPLLHDYDQGLRLRRLRCLRRRQQQYRCQRQQPRLCDHRHFKHRPFGQVYAA